MTADEHVALAKARSMLMILVATCKQTLLALEAADNAVDTRLTDDLRKMIDRSEDELDSIAAKLASARG
jgi:hypothetical protein